MGEKPLTIKQRRFVDVYIKTGNASEAYRQAGYAEKNADVDSYKLLVNPSISREIQKRLDTIHSENIADINETLTIVTAILRGETFEKIAMSIGNGKSSRVEVVEVPARIRDRLKAAEYILKIHGAFRGQNNESNIPTEIKIIRAGNDKNCS